MGEVIVTALGIKREKKALGYTVQEMQGEEITEAGEPNVVNSLAAQVTGVQMTNGSSGVGSTSLIVIRGASSLSGDNQALFFLS
ncbi:TonB-dependent receptor plug domain-containing protein [Porifericola rhodea]|nr:TonB-dependent receptor plug domain-containing protein [Porifericola rhodea]WKN33941.1 TonB-dependent receptor plug domain-containing protein [Porifericola rhodea]